MAYKIFLTSLLFFVISVGGINVMPEDFEKHPIVDTLLMVLNVVSGIGMFSKFRDGYMGVKEK